MSVYLGSASGTPLRRWVPEVLGGLGLVVLTTGTFLPWLASGTVLRNSYQSMAVAGRLTPLGDGAPGVMLAAWPALGGISAACLVLYVLGLRSIGALAAAVLAVLAGTVAAAVMVLLPAGDAVVHAVAVGPVVTITGAVLALAGAVTTLAVPSNRASRRTGQTE